MAKFLLIFITLIAFFGCGGGGGGSGSGIEEPTPPFIYEIGDMKRAKNSPPFEIKTVVEDETVKGTHKKPNIVVQSLDESIATIELVNLRRVGYSIDWDATFKITPKRDACGEVEFVATIKQNRTREQFKRKFKLTIPCEDDNKTLCNLENPRPKLWLSRDILENLRENQLQNSPSWERFKSMCDALVDSDSSNDPWGSNSSAGSDYTPQAFTAPLALIYYLTSKDRYARKAIYFMRETDTDISKYGDPDHKGYEKLALAYDWLEDFSGMSSVVRDEFHSKMRKISDNFYSRLNRDASGTDSDQNLLTGALHLMFGIALAGDFDDAKEIFNRGWLGWDRGFNGKISNRDIVKEALGGVYFTGMEYLPSTDIVGIAENWLSLETGCNYQFSKKEKTLLPFWGNLIQALISLTDPKQEIIEDYGSWQDPNTLTTQPWLYRALTIMSYFADKSGDKRAKYAKFFRENVDIGEKNDPFLEYFFDVPDENLSDESPYIQDALPLSYLAKAPDFLLYRDSWEAEATWVVFRGDGSIPMDHQAPDHGHFSIYRAGEYLTKGVTNYEALKNGDFFNTLSIENSCVVNGKSCSGTAVMDSQKRAEIIRSNISTSPNFAYVVLDTGGEWNSKSDQNVKSYRREFLIFGDYFVIFDRVRTKESVDIKYRLRALSRPTVEGNSVTQYSQSGESKLIQKSLIPKDVNITIIDENQLWQSGTDYDWIILDGEKHWQSVIDFGKQTSLNILNLIKIGNKSIELEETTTFDSDNIQGLRVGNLVAIFAKEERLLDGVTYDVKSPTQNQRHFIADLEAKDYEIFINGTKLKDAKVLENNNSLYFETTTTQNLHIEIR